MIKIIKWSAVACIVTALLSGEIAQASPENDKQPPQQEEQPVVLQYGKAVKVGFKEEDAPLARSLQQAWVVDKLDQVEKEFAYSQFNWVDLYSFLSEEIEPMAFISATKHKTDVVYRLMEKIMKKTTTATEPCFTKKQQAAKFLVYSALNSLYFHHLKYKNFYNPDNLILLQQLTSAAPYKSLQKDMAYHPLEPEPAYIKKTLMAYSDSFMGNPEIRALQLANKMEDLIAVITTCTNIKPYFTTLHESYQDCPTVENLLALYNPEIHPIVFACLLNHLRVLKQKNMKDKPAQLKIEKKLQNLIAKNFTELWSLSGLNIADREHLAKMAIFIFNMNPLQSYFNP